MYCSLCAVFVEESQVWLVRGWWFVRSYDVNVLSPPKVVSRRLVGCCVCALCGGWLCVLLERKREKKKIFLR